MEVVVVVVEDDDDDTSFEEDVVADEVVSAAAVAAITGEADSDVASGKVTPAFAEEASSIADIASSGAAFSPKEVRDADDGATSSATISGGASDAKSI